MERKRIDRNKLQAYLYKKADSRGVLEIHQNDLAAAMNVNYVTISRVFKKMVEEGRMKKIGRRFMGINVYAIEPPDALDDSGIESGPG